jgi:hypothetical protein
MMKYTHNRPAFSMITAIFVILLLATVAALIFNLSGKVVQETTTQYRKEQAILYAKSYTEFAIMAATSRDCVKSISADVGGTQTEVKQGKGYHVNVYIQYIGNELAGALGGTCDTLGTTPISYTDSKGTIALIDVYVRYRDPDHPSAINNVAWSSDSGITYHRRTLQKL